jgi:FMNH2-dependent dimethyl sulfone monooxygenase
MNPMKNANRFKLGLFSINADGGSAFTKVPNRWRADWPDIERAVQTADAAGLEFVLPIARWKGYGGETNVRAASFETLTHAATLAAVTRHIAIFATVHVPLVHPVFAAKALTTVDHVSRGRAGLNIVCGWNQEEFDISAIISPTTTPVTNRVSNGTRSSQRSLIATSPSTTAGSSISSSRYVVRLPRSSSRDR